MDLSDIRVLLRQGRRCSPQVDLPAATFLPLVLTLLPQQSCVVVVVVVYCKRSERLHPRIREHSLAEVRQTFPVYTSPSICLRPAQNDGGTLYITGGTRPFTSSTSPPTARLPAQ